MSSGSFSGDTLTFAVGPKIPSRGAFTTD
jgi:hypothetical protein